MAGDANGGEKPTRHLGSGEGIGYLESRAEVDRKEDAIQRYLERERKAARLSDYLERFLFATTCLIFFGCQNADRPSFCDKTAAAPRHGGAGAACTALSFQVSAGHIPDTEISSEMT